MQEAGFVKRYCHYRLLVFERREHLVIAHKLGLVLTMACLTGVLAQVRFVLPWTPVPLTGQTYAALIAGVLLGRRWGGLSLALYVLLGMMGMPWFNGAQGGLAVVLGPTGGYLLGFVLSAFVIGSLVDHHAKMRGFLPMLAIMTLANFILIYGLGLLQLGLWSGMVKGSAFSLRQLLWMGAVPFVPGDLCKIVLAAATAGLVTPKEKYL